MYLLLLSVAVTNAAPTNSNPVVNKRSSYGGSSLPYAKEFIEEEVYRPNKYEEIIEEKVYKNPIKYEEIIEEKVYKDPIKYEEIIEEKIEEVIC